MKTSVLVNGRPIEMEIDTGAALTVISEVTYRLTWGQSVLPLKKSLTVLRAYGGRVIGASDTITVQVQGAGVSDPKTLELHEVEGKGPGVIVHCVSPGLGIPSNTIRSI